MCILSIITITYNAESCIGATLDSVAEQDSRDFEHLIIDGSSTDCTLDIIKNRNYKELKLISEKDAGIYDAMNKGIKAARGQYIVFLNAGDSFFDGGSVKRIIKAIKENENADVIYGQTVLVNNAEKIIGERHYRAPKQLDYKSFKKGMLVCHQAFVTRKQRIPFYDLKYRFSADYDWCIKILKDSKTNIYLGDKPLIKYLNEGTTTKNHTKSLRERFVIMARHYGLGHAITRHLAICLKFIYHKFKL